MRYLPGWGVPRNALTDGNKRNFDPRMLNKYERFKNIRASVSKMIDTPQRFRNPAHTVVDTLDGCVLVSTVHIGHKEFETMVFPMIGEMPYTSTELAQRRVHGEGSADNIHRKVCNEFDKAGAEYIPVSTGNYRPNLPIEKFD